MIDAVPLWSWSIMDQNMLQTWCFEYKIVYWNICAFCWIYFIGKFFLLPVYLGCKTNQRSISFEYFLLMVYVCQGPLYSFGISGVFSFSTKDAEWPADCG